MSSSVNFSDNQSLINTCLRCGYEWRSNRIGGQPAYVPPVRCARCRSPLWNTPRQNNMRKRERDRQAGEQLRTAELDRDGYERLYREEKERRQQLEAEVKYLREGIKDDGRIIDAYEAQVRRLEMQLRLKEKDILELLGQRRLIK